MDYHVDHPGTSYTEFEQYKALRVAKYEESPMASIAAAPSTQKEQYLKNKQANADARKRKAMLERLKKECTTLEEELASIEEELFGSAASDYVRAAELDTRRAEVEERLLEIYGELENEE